MKLRTLPILATTALALMGTVAPAHAAGSSAKIHLVVSTVTPVFGDDNDLIYNITVTNKGPAEATGVVLRVTIWNCKNDLWSAATCTLLPDRKDPTQTLSYDVTMDPIKVGEPDSFPVVSYFPDESSGVIRTTVEVIKSDQTDTASVPNTCAQGATPQDDCASEIATIE